MPALEEFLKDLQSLGERLDAPELEPDRNAVDWTQKAAEIAELRSALDYLISDSLEAALAEAKDDIQRERFEAAVSALASEVAVLCWLAGDEASAGAIMATAIELAPPDSEASVLRGELEAASKDLAIYAVLVEANWLHRKGRFEDGDALLKRVRKSVASPPLAKAYDRVLASPRPLRGGAPSLHTINGVGFMLYGARDHAPDGTYVATHCFTVLFIPILAVAAYRVRHNGAGSYTFFARVPLSPFARASRWGLLAVALLAAGVWALSSWSDSPSHQAQLALDRAAAAERDGRADEALTLYEEAAIDYVGAVPASALARAANAVVSLSLAKIAEPMVAGRIDQASRVVVRYRSLPSSLQGGEAAQRLTKALERWAGQVGSKGLEASEASLRLLRLAETVAEPPDLARVETKRRALDLAVGGLLAGEWPLEAFEHYAAAMPEPRAVDAAATTAQKLAESPSLLLEAEPTVELWIAAAGGGKLSPLAAEVSSALAEARALRDDPERQKLLASSDEAALRAALEARPADHEVAAALAEALRGRGDAPGAIALLEKLGRPGELSTAAQRALAGSLADAGRLEPAAAILSRHVARRLPAFQAARHDYEAATQRASDLVLAELRAGEIPPDLESQLSAASESEQPLIAQRWIAASLERDPHLAGLRATYERLAEVVPAVLALGNLELRQANESGGDERTRHLDAAERHFLSIREEAEGVPEYHLGLGQVYHRLGRAADGERELSSVLAGHDSALDLAVARVYRELGLVARAREVAQAVYDRGDSTGGNPQGQAAALMALLADRLEDEETWLNRAPPDDPFVRTSLLEVRGKRLLQDNHPDQAAELFARAADDYDRESAHSAAAANNAALDRQAIYLCTGELATLDRAVEGLEKAYRLEPDNALATYNLAELLAYKANVAALDRWVRTPELRLSNESANAVVDELLATPLRQTLAGALAADPALRRALDLDRQAQTLAPSFPPGFGFELNHALHTDDVAGLRRLRDRLEHVRGLDTSAEEAQRARFASGTDASTLALLDSIIASRHAMTERARRTHHPPTLAVALLLETEALGSRAAYRGDLEDAEAALTALDEAERAWPDLDTESTRAWVLVHRAVVREQARCEPLARVWQSDARSFGVPYALHRAMTGPGGDQVIATLRAAPEIAEAIALVRVPVARPRGVADWVLARLAGDAELEAAAAREQSTDRALLEAEIAARLSNGAPADAQRLELVRAIRAASSEAPRAVD